MGETTFSIDGPSTLRGAVVLLVVGLAATGFGVYDYVQQSDAVEDSVEVDAEILELGAETSGSTGSSGTDYRPTVRFEYEYDGTSYTGTSVFPSETTPNYDTRSAARSVLEEYETGETATAYVDPANPDDAFLKNQTSNAPLLFVGIGLFFVAVGGVSTAKRYRQG